MRKVIQRYLSFILALSASTAFSGEPIARKRQNLGYIFNLQGEVKPLTGAQAPRLPRSISLAFIEVSANLEGVKLRLPLEVQSEVARDTVEYTTKNFQISAKNSKQVEVTVDLRSKFHWAIPMDGDALEEYFLQFRFLTNREFSYVSQARLQLVRRYSSDHYHSSPEELPIMDYQLEEVQYQLPLYPGDEQ